MTVGATTATQLLHVCVVDLDIVQFREQQASVTADFLETCKPESM